MNQSGTISLLGAEASAEAGYPMAINFLSAYTDLLQQFAQYQEGLRRQGNPVSPLPPIDKWFNEQWSYFAESSRKMGVLDVPGDDPDGRPSLLSTATLVAENLLVAAADEEPFLKAQSSDFEPYLESFFAFL